VSLCCAIYGLERRADRVSCAAVTFFERAKGSAAPGPSLDREDLSPVVSDRSQLKVRSADSLSDKQLAEALLTLANLTSDENKREELYARAQTEGGDVLHLELDPPPTALPASISSIVAVARPTLLSPVLQKDPGEGACSMSIEASPSFIFASSSKGAFAPGRPEGNGGEDQPMVVDVRRDDVGMRMDES
jgi:hypothetical protein